MEIVIRQQQGQDWVAAAHIRARALPRDANERSWLSDSQGKAPSNPWMWVAVVGGRVVGTAMHSKPEGRLLVAGVHVDPAERGRGVGTALASYLVDRLRSTAHSEARLGVDDQHDGSVRFARRFGAVSGTPTAEFYELDTSTVDAWSPEFPGSSRRVAVRRLLESDLSDQSVAQAVHALHVAAETEPFVGGGPTEPLEEWGSTQLRRLRGGGAIVIAVAEGELVGVSSAAMCVHVPVARTSLTYVRPEWRAGGVGTALKAEVCRWARDAGVSRLQSSVAEQNVSIHRANQKLGFIARPTTSWTLPLKSLAD